MGRRNRGVFEARAPYLCGETEKNTKTSLSMVIQTRRLPYNHYTVTFSVCHFSLSTG